MLDVVRELEKCLNENIACVVVTVIDITGSTPAKIGFKMIAGHDGIIAGTVGGGGLEYYALGKCTELIEKDEKFFTGVFDLNASLKRSAKKSTESKDKNIKINSLCGGEVKLFFEVFQRNKTIHIFGAGHVSRCLIKYASDLKYFVNVYDARSEMLTEIPETAFVKKHPCDLMKLSGFNKNDFNIKEEDFIIIVTHNHLNDLNVLEYLYNNYNNIRYIGMIGSAKKVKEGTEYLKSKLKAGINLNNLYAPIGINIGGETPAEIALSIMAEIQAVSFGKDANHLRIKY